MRTVLAVLMLFNIGVGGLIRVALADALVKIARAQARLATTLDVSACEPGAIGLVLTGSEPSLSLYGVASIGFYRPELLKHMPALFVLSLAQHDQRLALHGPHSFTLAIEGLPRRSNIFERLFTDAASYVGREAGGVCECRWRACA